MHNQQGDNSDVIIFAIQTLMEVSGGIMNFTKKNSEHVATIVLDNSKSNYEKGIEIKDFVQGSNFDNFDYKNMEYFVKLAQKVLILVAKEYNLV